MDQRSTETSMPPWRRWRAWAAGAVAVALYAAFGFFIVPMIARSQIEKQARTLLHRQATVSGVRFNPFTLAAIVEGLTLKDRDGSDLFHLDRLAANLQVSGIFRRAWRFREIVIDGPHAVARIGADGRLSIADLLEDRPGEEPKKPATALPRAIIDRFAVSRGSADFVDETRSPRFIETASPLDLELHDLTTIPDESGDHSITLGLNEGARVRWSGRQMVEPLRLEGKIEIEDIRLPRVWNYVAADNPLGMREGRADVSCSYEITRGTDRALSVGVKDISATVRDLAMQPRSGGDDWLTVPRVTAHGGQLFWPESRVEVAGIVITGPHALALLEKGGVVNWQAAIPAKSAAPENTSTPPIPWTVKIGSVEISDGSAHFEDRSFTPPIVVDHTEIALKLHGVTSDLTAPIPMTFSARVNGSGESRASGTVVVDPPGADLDVKASGIELAPIARYAVRLRGLDVRHGVLTGEGKLHAGSGSPKVRFDGGVELTGFQVAGGGTDRLVACDRAAVRGAAVTVLPTKIRLAKVELDGAFVKLDIDREGRVNLKEVLAADRAQDGGTVPAPTPGTGEPPPLDIGLIAIKNAGADYTDESVILPFGTKIHAINGSIKDISTTSPVPATLALEGRISNTGYFKSDGTMRLAAPFAATDVTVVFRGVDMPELTPYSAQFAGYSIEHGSLDVDIRYRIKDGRLVGDHRVIAKDLTLGPKVEGAKGPGLPVRLAISLLKDASGRIDLAVPVEGTIDSPEFNYKSVFWQAFKTILGNVAKAPFSAIGRLFGANDEELELVGFAAGRSDLPAPEQERLAKLGATLAAKADLSLAIEGRYDPVKDVEAIRLARLAARIDAKRDTTPKVETILEELYTESFSKDRLDEERKKYPDGADAAAFYDTLRGQLLAAEELTQSDLTELGRARGAAIAAALTAPGGLDPSRVKVEDPAAVKRKKQGSELVASEMTLSAGD